MKKTENPIDQKLQKENQPLLYRIFESMFHLV